jgi:hypothetical protein
MHNQTKLLEDTALAVRAKNSACIKVLRHILDVLCETTSIENMTDGLVEEDTQHGLLARRILILCSLTSRDKSNLVEFSSA